MLLSFNISLLLFRIQEQRAERKHEKERQLQASGLSGEELSRMKAVLTNPYLDSNYSEFSENLETTNLYISYLPLDVSVKATTYFLEIVFRQRWKTSMKPSVVSVRSLLRESCTLDKASTDSTCSPLLLTCRGEMQSDH